VYMAVWCLHFVFFCFLFFVFSSSVSIFAGKPSLRVRTGSLTTAPHRIIRHCYAAFLYGVVPSFVFAVLLLRLARRNGHLSKMGDGGNKTTNQPESTHAAYVLKARARQTLPPVCEDDVRLFLQKRPLRSARCMGGSRDEYLATISTRRPSSRLSLVLAEERQEHLSSASSHHIVLLPRPSNQAQTTVQSAVDTAHAVQRLCFFHFHLPQKTEKLK